MRIVLIFISVIVIFAQQGFAAGSSLLRSGNSAYENKKYGTAFEFYQKAAQKGSTGYGEYNSGAALYRLKDYAGSAKAYLNSSEQDPDLKQNAYFNAGNAFYNSDKAKAIALYRQAYMMNLKDEAALHNLQLAVQEQQKDKQNQQDKKNNKNNNNNNSQNNQDKQDKQNNKDKNQQEKQDNQNKENNISKEEADSVLQMLKEQGNNVLAPAAQPRQETVDKDW